MTREGSVVDGLLWEGVTDADLLTEALTHRSAGSRNNERLEYLGDAVLGLVVSDYLYRRFDRFREGDLSRLRSYLVRKETLAEVAASIGLGEKVILGAGELKSGGSRRDTILANAMEALIGAAYITRGFDHARALVMELWRDKIDSLPSPQTLKDPKTRLQEWLQSRNLGLPEYELADVTGESHRQRFQTRCRVSALALEASAWGDSKRKSEQACAGEVLSLIGRRE
ncbi:MAG: ribonuclease III [Pseudomonadota bacterium]|nr:ribonuclease III [Pseudomonadota bacterium]